MDYQMCSFLRQLFLSLERTLYIIVREPNSENCLDLIFAVLPCEKVTRYKLYHICNQKIYVGYAKSW